MTQNVNISFDCLPLRSVSRLDIPIDASPAFRARCERIKAALDAHGTFNTYYLYNAGCTFRLTNDDELGMLRFRFEGTVMTDAEDQHTERCALQIELVAETCDWLTEPAVAWMKETVEQAVRVEFDRYIAAGDLNRAKERIAKLQATSDALGGYVGMGL